MHLQRATRYEYHLSALEGFHPLKILKPNMANTKPPRDTLKSAAWATELVLELVPHAWLPRGPALGFFRIL